jgi:plastocyanin
MSIRRRLGFLLAAALGAAVVVLPAIAASETAPTTVTAVNTEGIYKEQHHYWSPSAATVSVGGAVAFKNPYPEVAHGFEWTGGPPPPSCPGVPVGSSGTNWHGECTFTQPGTYTFRCTVHPTEMTGTVTVNANGTTTTTTTPTGTTTSTTTTTTTVPGEIATGAAGAQGSPLAGSASSALRVASRQRGKSVHGSVDISRAGAGGRLEVDLLAASASLASAGHQPKVRVGRLVRTALKAGKLSFSVSLNARARPALNRHHHLALTVRVEVTPASGSAVTVTRGVVVRS